MSNYFVGIDPGFLGGVAVLREDGYLAQAVPMPVEETGGKRQIDIPSLVDLLATYGSVATVSRPRASVVVALERAGARPGEGRGSIATYLQGYGEIRGALRALSISMLDVAPQTWKKLIFTGRAKGKTKAEQKAAAVAYVRQRYPDANLLPTPRHKVPKDGIAEAICLAEYAMRVTCPTVFSTQAAPFLKDNTTAPA
jgi:hypothetical protein